MKLNLFIFLLCIVLVNTRIVMIIRHGEKITDALPYLSPRGEARAKCLINVFGPNGTFISPDKIFAQNPTNKKKSTRPRDTVIPLAKSLNLTVDLSFSRHKVLKLINYIIDSKDEVTLISWSRQRIPEIAELLGIKNPPTFEKEFDNIWVISDGNTPVLRNPKDIENVKISNLKSNSKLNSEYLINQSNGFRNNRFSIDTNLLSFNANSNKKDNSVEIYNGVNNVTLTIYKQNIEDCIERELTENEN